MPKKGYKQTEEHKQKISKENKGKSPWCVGLTKETDSRVRSASEKKKGKIHSGTFKKGHASWNKDKTGVYSKESLEKMSLARKGKKDGPHSEEHKKKISESLKGHKTSWSGNSHTEATKSKMSNSHKGKVCSNETRKKISEGHKDMVFTLEHKKALSISRLKYMENHHGPFMNTKIELLIKNELDKLSVKYIQQKRLLKYSVDFFLFDYNIIIECDGEFWHADPRRYNSEDILYRGLKAKDIWKKDKIRELALKKQGYKLYCFWEFDIRKSPIVCLNKIKEIL